MRYTQTALTALFLLTACSGDSATLKSAVHQGEAALENGSKTILVTNAKIWTQNPEQPWADFMVLQGSEIQTLGTAEELPETPAEVWDMEGGLIVPGFHDLHLHVLEAGYNSNLGLVSPGADPETYAEEIASIAEEQADQVWVRAAGMSVTVFEGELSPIELLDEAVPDRPVIVLDDVGHAAYGNTRALRLAGIQEDSPDPQGGVVLRDAKTGKLTGALLENAQQVLRDAAAPGHEAMYAGLLGALAELAANGITTISDAGGYWTRDHHVAWLKAEKEEALTVRAFNALYVYPDHEVGEQLTALRGMYRSDPNSLLQFNIAKMYLDGILTLGTARLVEPYSQAPNPDWPAGFPYFSDDAAAIYTAALHQHGFQIHYHTVGDGAVRQALDLVAGLAEVDPSFAQRRHRTTHNYLVDPKDLPRFSKLGVVADLQVGVDSVAQESVNYFSETIGERALRLIPVADLVEAGAHVVLSSDWDADLLSPLGIIERAITRPYQALPGVESAIQRLTIDGARALRMESRTGSLEAGKLADFVLLDRNIFELAPDQVSEAKVLMTVLGGRVVYEQ